MDEYVVIYHANCADGFTAAWVARRFISELYANMIFVPAKYGDEPPDVSDKHVIVADFSYPRDTLLAMNNQAKSLVVFDHHESAEKELAELPFCVFDMKRSGAMLTWEELIGDVEPPMLVKYVQDRDLWQWELDDSRAINSWIGSFEMQFKVWDSMHDTLESEEGRLNAAMQGYAIERYKAQLIERVVKNATVERIDGCIVPVVNSPVLQSELGHELSKRDPFAGVWWIDGDGNRVMSLRSTKDGANVAEIATKYGGGGHRHAAGFRTKTTFLSSVWATASEVGKR